MNYGGWEYEVEEEVEIGLDQWEPAEMLLAAERVIVKINKIKRLHEINM